MLERMDGGHERWPKVSERRGKTEWTPCRVVASGSYITATPARLALVYILNFKYLEWIWGFVGLLECFLECGSVVGGG